MTYLIDTCILSKLRKIRTHTNKAMESWFEKHIQSDFYISVLSIGEIQKGIAKLGKQNSTQKTILENWLMEELIPQFENQLLSIDSETCLIWGEICGSNQTKGNHIPVIDTLLAATAIQHNLILVTENTKDFVHTGVRLFNPL